MIKVAYICCSNTLRHIVECIEKKEVCKHCNTTGVELVVQSRTESVTAVKRACRTESLNIILILRFLCTIW